MNTDEGTLKIWYDGDGEAIKHHQMKASLVADSIKAMETIYVEAFKEASKVLNTTVQAEVFLDATSLDNSATPFQEGSLWWILKVIGKGARSQDSFDGRVNYPFITKIVSRVINILKLLSEEQTEITFIETESGYQVKIDGEYVDINDVEHAILTSEKILKAVSDLAVPILQDGVDILNIQDKNELANIITVNKEESARLIIKRKYKKNIEDGNFSGLFFVEDLSYNPNSKWKFVHRDDPKYNFKAVIEDEIFLKKVFENKQDFRKDDLLEIEGIWAKAKKKYTARHTTTHTVKIVKKHISVQSSRLGILEL